MSQSQILPFSGGSGGGGGGGGGGSTAPGKPRILWNNLMSEGSPSSVTASSEPDPANYPHQNCYDGRAYTYWKVAAGTNYLTFVFSSAKSVNAYAFYSPGQETLFNLGGTFQLQYSLDGGTTWLNFRSAEAPTNSTPIYRTATSVSANRWRWKFVCASDFFISILSFGTDFEWERGDWVGVSPPKFARDTTLTNNTSQGGNWLGRSVIRNGMSMSFNIEWVTESFINTYWYDFMIWAEQKPWFLLYNGLDFPADAAYCWSDAKIGMPMNSHPNYMGTKLKIMGRTN